MTRKGKFLIVLLCILFISMIILGCVDLDGPDRIRWQETVMARQREGLPTSTSEPGE